MTPRKIAIFYLVTLAESGGAQRYVADLATNLPPAEFSVVVAAGGAGELLERLRQVGVNTYHLTHLRRDLSPYHDLAAIAEITGLLRQLKPDVLHLNSSKAGVLGSIAARLAGVPRVVYTAHGFVFNEPLRGWQQTTYRWLERWTARYKHRIICVAEADRQSALRNRIAPAVKLVTIHNGLDLNRIHFVSKEVARSILAKCIPATENLPATSYQLVGTIANFYPTKGLPDLAAAAAQVVLRVPTARFVIVGDGPARTALKRLIRQLHLQDQIWLPGAISNARQLIPAFDVYCSSSLKEGLPYSILEAMAAERPIAATAVGGLPEIIDDGKEGLLVEAGNPRAMAAAVVRLLHDPALAKRLGLAARARVAAQCTLQTMVEQTAACYREGSAGGRVQASLNAKKRGDAR